MVLQLFRCRRTGSIWAGGRVSSAIEAFPGAGARRAQRESQINGVAGKNLVRLVRLRGVGRRLRALSCGAPRTCTQRRDVRGAPARRIQIARRTRASHAEDSGGVAAARMGSRPVVGGGVDAEPAIGG